MARQTLKKRGQVDPEVHAAAAESENQFYRRTALNKALGMTARNPFAFQLSDEELVTAEVGAAASNPPVPIAAAANGLQMLVDPWREELRRRERSVIPDASLEERRARYVSREGVLS